MQPYRLIAAENEIIEPVELKSEMFALVEAGQTVEISKALYREMRDVLPCYNIGSNYFVFREGGGPKIRFTDTGNGFWAKRIK